MGNPASPILANIVMNYILKKVEGMLPFQVPFLKIQFTIEVENNKTLPFLDLSILIKEDGSILTDWYVKPTSSGASKQLTGPVTLMIGTGAEFNLIKAYVLLETTETNVTEIVQITGISQGRHCSLGTAKIRIFGENVEIHLV
ncbi:hypothetical protein M0804_013328 [Polistes exclamans]|nr:hypothetical protein M0804_013328 [Polistes exclamans]